MLESFSLSDFLTWYAILLVALTIHEAGHALVAYLGGDLTAYRGGQVTLNPWPHIKREPFGMVLMPILSFIGGGVMMGWASAPYDPYWGRRHPRRLAAMAAAGPAANLLLALLCFGLLKALLAAGVFLPPDPDTVAFERLVSPSFAWAERPWTRALGVILSIALNLNLLLALFNLLPLPPLDGSGILEGLFPRSIGPLLQRLRAEPLFALIGLVVAWKLFSYRPVFLLLLHLLHPGSY